MNKINYFNWEEYGGEIFINVTDHNACKIIVDQPKKVRRDKKSWYTANRERILAAERLKREAQWRREGRAPANRISKRMQGKAA